MDEHKLVEQIMAGDTHAYSILVEQNQSRVYSVALSFVKNPDDAMDIAQETFIKAWKSIGTWRGQASLATWLCKIAANLSLDLLRKRKRVVPVEHIQYTSQQVVPGADSNILALERKRELAQVVEALPDDYRELVVLRHTGGLSYQEIADTLNLSLSQVKNRLMRARQSMKKSLTRGAGR